MYNIIKVASKEKTLCSPRKRAILTTMRIAPHCCNHGILFTFSFKAFSFENYVIFFHDCNYVASKQGIFKSFVYNTVILSPLSTFILM
jgi:hypothetical protein